MSLKVSDTGAIQLEAGNFLLVLHCNYISNLYHFWNNSMKILRG